MRSEEVLLREGAMYECYFGYEALRGAEEGCARDSFLRGGENKDMKRSNRGGANPPETKRRLLRLQKYSLWYAMVGMSEKVCAQWRLRREKRCRDLREKGYKTTVIG